MMQARLSMITADPAQLGHAMTVLHDEVRPGVEGQPGSLGIALAADPELGVAVLESVWSSADALIASEDTVGLARSEIQRRAAATVSVQRYEVPVFELDAPLQPGAGLRVMQLEIKPSQVEDGIEAYGDVVVPTLADVPGFRAAQLLVDPRSGHAVSATGWRDAHALAASRRAGAAIRVELTRSADWLITAMGEYHVLYSSARKP
jgi:Antibiotic biosynthesis monooxygenase